MVGIASSGIHSNGLTLARRVLFRESMAALSEHVAALGRTLGEELLAPTHIYVREAMQMLDDGLAVRALIHITSDGLLNLARVASETGYVIDEPLESQPIFSMIQRRGSIPDPEMFRVYNMGTGFCVIVAPRDADRVVSIAAKHGRARQGDRLYGARSRKTRLAPDLQADRQGRQFRAEQRGAAGPSHRPQRALIHLLPLSRGRRSASP